jgi:hypothetical protein
VFLVCLIFEGNLLRPGRIMSRDVKQADGAMSGRVKPGRTPSRRGGFARVGIVRAWDQPHSGSDDRAAGWNHR